MPWKGRRPIQPDLSVKLNQTATGLSKRRFLVSADARRSDAGRRANRTRHAEPSAISPFSCRYASGRRICSRKLKNLATQDISSPALKYLMYVDKTQAETPVNATGIPTKVLHQVWLDRGRSGLWASPCCLILPKAHYRNGNQKRATPGTPRQTSAGRRLKASSAAKIR